MGRAGYFLLSINTVVVDRRRVTAIPAIVICNASVLLLFKVWIAANMVVNTSVRIVSIRMFLRNTIVCFIRYFAFSVR